MDVHRKAPAQHRGVSSTPAGLDKTDGSQPNETTAAENSSPSAPTPEQALQASIDSGEQFASASTAHDAAALRTQTSQAVGAGETVGKLGFLDVPTFQGPQFFAGAPRPDQQPLELGQATGFHAVREEGGKHLLDTSDAVCVPAPPEQLRAMIEGNWTEQWWGGTSETEGNAKGPGEVSNFDFIPEKVAGLPLARLNIAIQQPQVSRGEDGSTVWTYRARLQPRSGNNPGDDVGRIKDTGDIQGDMRIHVAARPDGNCVFQLDWRGMEIEPRPAMPFGLGKLIDKMFNPSHATGSVLDRIGRGFYGVVGGGHNETLRPEPDSTGNKPLSGFHYLFAQLNQPGLYRGNVPFKDAHPALAKERGLHGD